MSEVGPSPGHAGRAGRRGIALGAVALLGLLVAAVAAWVAWGPSHLADSVPHLVAGVAALASGLYVTQRVHWSRIGPLLVLMGFLWFTGDFVTCLNIEPLSHRCLATGPVGELLGRVAWLWLGVLGHVLLTYSRGRTDTTPQVVLIALIYILVLVMPEHATPTTELMALLVVVGTTVRWGRAAGPDRSDRSPALLAGVALAVGLLAREVVPVQVLELVVTLVSVGLAAALVEISTRRAAITPDRAVGLRDELAAAMGDPVLRVAYRAPDRDAWVDREGRDITPPTEAAGLSITYLERDGAVLAALTHDPATLAEPEVRQAVLTAVELAAHNARLAAELEAQVSQVGASRRRLLDVALQERRELGALVDHHVERPLGGLAEGLRAIDTALTDGPAREHLVRAAGHLDDVRREVRDMAAGLYPKVLADVGLASALRELAGRTAIPVDLAIPDDLTGGPAVDAAAYFLCAEAVANATRHAPGGRVSITVSRKLGALSVLIQDDGPGGADESLGTGLRGLRDRVEAMDGTLRIDSAPDTGTRLEATIPVAPDSRPDH
jgi:signal transduction histidine kinase